MKARLILALFLALLHTAHAADDAYFRWARERFSAATVADPAQRATVWGENADPDRDGLANLLEYAADTNPNQPTPASDCFVYQHSAGWHPQLTAHLRTDDPDLRVLCQTSHDLFLWLPQAPLNFTTPQPANPIVLTDDLGLTARGLRIVRYTDLLDVPARGSAFMRLLVARRDAVAAGPGLDPVTFTSQTALPYNAAAPIATRSNTVVLSGFTGTVSVAIPPGVTLYVNGVAVSGSVATVKAGDHLWMEAFAHATAGVPRHFDLGIGTTTARWTVTAAAPATVADHPGTESGYTPVETGVSDTGAAQISIPIVVSPGTAGMQPKLAIAYSSQGGNGPLGLGFSLSGLSAISRTGATVAQDGFKGGIAFDANDRFALDGQRLIAISSPDGGDGTEYRPEFDPSTRIRSYGVEGSGPQRWVVETKAGLTMEFGLGANSRIKPEGGTAALAWAVEKIADTVGNAMLFTYDEIARQRSETLITRIAYTTRPPSTVANQEVVFEYEDRPDARTSYVGGFAVKMLRRMTALESRATEGATMKRVRRYTPTYDAGEITNSSRMTQIVEATSDGTQLPPTIVSWDTNGPRGFTNGMSLSTDHAFIGTTWNSQYEPFSSSPPARIVSGDFNADGIMDIVHMSDHPAAFLPYSQYIAFGKLGGGFTFMSGLGGLLTKTMVSSDYSRLRVGDFNGDGKSDLLHVLYTGTDNWVGLSNGDGTFTLRQGAAQIGSIASQTMQPTFASELLTIDITGDGRTDVIYLETGKMAVYVANGDGSFTKATNTGLENYRIEERTNYSNWGWVIPGDFNGDGKADILYGYRSKDTATPPHQSWLALSNGDGTFAVLPQDQLTGFDSLTWDNNHPQLVSGDFNGDGLTDVFQMSPPARAPNWVALSKGNGTFAVSTPAPPIQGFQISSQPYTHMQSADLNGDGFDDIFSADAYNTNLYTFAALSNGDGTFQFLQTTNLGPLNGTTYSTGDLSRLFIGDFDGDGAADIFHLQRNHDHYLAQLNGFERNRVTAVSSGHGGSTAFAYKPLTDPSVHTKSIGAPYPCYDLQAPMFVVSAITSRNGIDGDAFTGAGAGTPGTNTVEYRYEGAWTCLDGRGFQGFKAVVTTDLTSGIVSRAESLPLTFGTGGAAKVLGSRPSHSQQSLLPSKIPDGGSALISDSDVFWTVAETLHPTGFRTYQINEARTVARTYEINRAVSAVVKSVVREHPTVSGAAMDYDSYGNLRGAKTTTSGNGTHFTEVVQNTYDNHTTGVWHLGRLRDAVVTKDFDNGTADTPSITRRSSFDYHPTTGLLITETIQPGDPLQQVKTYLHDAFGNIQTSTITVAGEAPRTTNTTYTPDGRFVATTTNAKGHTETKIHDSLLGNVLTQTGPNGLTTSWQYDALGRPIRETRPDGTETRSFYRRVTGSTVGAPPRAVHYVRVQSTGGAPKTVWFDLLDREIRSDTVGFDGRTVSAHKVFDAKGQVSHASQPYFAGDAPLYSTMEYDALGRETWQTDPGNRFTATKYLEFRTTIERNYNPEGLGQFQKAIQETNAMGWTVKSSQYLGSAEKLITRTYDAYGSLKTVTDPAGNVTTLGYDIRGNKTSMSEPNSGASSFTYNGFGELQTQTNSAGQTVSLSYDVLGRVLMRTDVAEQATTTFTYDNGPMAKGQLVAESSPGFSRVFYYDALARPAGSVETHGVHGFAVSRSYDVAGRPDALTFPTGFGVRQSYTALGHLAVVQNAANPSLFYWAALQVNARGQVSQEVLGNGVVTDRAFEAETGLIDGIKTSFGGDGDVQELEFDFDLIGNLTERRDARFSTQFIETFGYDTLNRLKTVRTKSGASQLSGVDADYNDIGNIISRTDVGTFNYATGRPHAVSSVSGSSGGAFDKACDYDLKGNRTTDGATTLDYSSFNKPTRISKGGDLLRFDYGPDRSLFRQTTFRTDAAGATTQTVREYIGGLYERETTSDGLVRHIHYVAGGSGVVAIHTDERSASTAAQRTRFVHKDHLGSVDVLTDNAGVVVERQSFDAWGRRRTVKWSGTAWTVTYPATPAAGASPETHRGFTGHEMLDAVGLVHMGGRVYDPLTARFLSPDPFVQSPDNLQNLNRYSYVLNNPLSFTDPSGFFFKSVGKFFKKHWKTIAAVGVGILTAGAGVWGAAILAGQSVSLGTAFSAIAGAGGFGLTGIGAAVAGAGFGFGSAFSGTLLAGGSVGDALRAGLKSGAISGASAFGAFQVGEAFGHATTSKNYLRKVAAHGIVSGGASELSGGKFAHGFYAGAFSAGLNPVVGRFGSGEAYRIAAAAVVGGTASEIGGGKFANGAVSGAFVQIFNENQTTSQKAKAAASTAADVYEGVERVNDLDIELSSKTGRPTMASIKLKGLLTKADPLMKSVNLHAETYDFVENPSAKNAIDVAGVFAKPLSGGMFISEYGVKGANWVGVQTLGQDNMADMWLYVGDSWVGAGIEWSAYQLNRPWR